MLFAFGPEDLERLAIPIGIGIAALIFLIVPSYRKSVADSYKKGREARQKHPMLAWVANVVGVILLIIVVVWFVFWRK
jgi:hypothetical protein